MAINAADLGSYVGAGGSDVALLGTCLAEAVDLLRGYLRHLRVFEDGALVGEVTATLAADTWTWTDTRVLPEDHHTGTIPVALLDSVTKLVASDLFTRRNAPNGLLSQQFVGPDGPVQGAARLHRDPLIPAYPLLARWTVPF